MARKEEKAKIQSVMDALENLLSIANDVYEGKENELSATEEDTEKWYDLSDDKEIISDLADSIESAIKNCEYYLKW